MKIGPNEFKFLWNMVNTIRGSDTHLEFAYKIQKYFKVLEKNTTSRTRSETMVKIPAQAERTAWKIVLDWIEIQMAMIDLAQIEIMEVFLPYVYDAQKDMTFFEQIKSNHYKALLPGTNKSST